MVAVLGRTFRGKPGRGARFLSRLSRLKNGMSRLSRPGFGMFRLSRPNVGMFRLSRPNKTNVRLYSTQLRFVSTLATKIQCFDSRLSRPTFCKTFVESYDLSKFALKF